ncbi:hypothetical protein K432DRAFT_359597 [Lepidopterella palustris CBS 459.81]|uniref:DUF803-domain-containing protein n=1 Tax=Lepidopterella palustris CBS 459.81 TaxID=1314670 RepID=A0A8E2E3S3_9PEZI|nr:hypothetical protein K432DRAFT_359597 [Lepidopterella palustris CBS 459.81]
MVDISPGASVALGVIVGLLSTSIQSIGLTLQRKSHLLEEEKEDGRDRRPPYRRRRWQLGMLMFIVSNLVGSTIQITTLPLPVLSTLQASGLVFNSICASIILSEPFTRHSLIGTILVAAGAVLIGTFGALTEPSHNLDQLLQLLGRRQFLLWLSGTGFAVVLILGCCWSLKRIYPRPTPRLRLVRGMLFGCVSGILSAHSLLVAKTAVELLVRTIVDRHNEFNRWQSWMILVGLVSLALSQLYFMHRGLKLCSTSVLYPLVFCVYNIIAILDGLIYFHQSSRLPAWHAGLIAVGTVILLSGVLALSWRLDESTHVPGSPTMHIKHKGRVPTPQTALAPGMSLVGSIISDESSEYEGDEEGSALTEYLFDEESGLASNKSGLSPLPGTDGKRKRKRSADETTPLLRASTSPALTQPKKRASSTWLGPKPIPSPRLSTPRRRRMTVSQEAGEIWDELNDREDLRRSGSLRAPARRSVDLERRPGTLPTRRADVRGGGQWRRRSWWEGMGIESGMGGSGASGKRPVVGADEEGRDEGEETDTSGPTEALLGSEGRNGGMWGLGLGEQRRRGERDGLGDWFKLRWWRKRWRDDGGGCVPDGEGREGSETGGGRA